MASARQKYLGKKGTIKGPLESPQPGMVARHYNWRGAKQGAHGRYYPESDADWARLSFGYERKQATIIAIQLSEVQPKDPWVDILGNHHEANEDGPHFDFIVRFDDDAVGMCTCTLNGVEANFEVIAPKPAAQK